LSQGIKTRKLDKIVTNLSVFVCFITLLLLVFVWEKNWVMEIMKNYGLGQKKIYKGQRKSGPKTVMYLPEKRIFCPSTV
jgi:hypothetical protein